MKNVLCHLGDPRSAKPTTLQEYGKLREKIIQREWVSLPEYAFVHLVTERGCPFYGGLLNGRDLQELRFEKLCWRTQSLVGLDFDVCTVSEAEMSLMFDNLGIRPWLSYFTFSSGSVPGTQSYRLLWRVDIDLNLTYDECARALKKMRLLSGKLSDKHASNPTRMWQGSNSGFCRYDAGAPRLNLKKLASNS